VRKWGFWDWVAYICIAIAAVMMAFDAAVKSSANLTSIFSFIVDNRLWQFTPAVAVVISAIIIAAERLGWIEATAEKPTTDTAIALQFYGDYRHPTVISERNLWRYYNLTMQTTLVESSGTKHVMAISVLFVTFVHPVRVGSLIVSSPDIALPMHEVKEFNDRFAVITFSGALPFGTLNLTLK
jgi:hypothetical protein